MSFAKNTPEEQIRDLRARLAEAERERDDLRAVHDAGETWLGHETEGREALGRVVRRVWVAWAREQPDVGEHPSWLVPWEALPERDREVDRQIAATLARAVFHPMLRRTKAAWAERDAAIARADRLDTQAQELAERLVYHDARAEAAIARAEAAERERDELRAVVEAARATLRGWPETEYAYGRALPLIRAALDALDAAKGGGQ